ncbi:hypothetical protein [endosymbiont GvMRE of Glomus versiforme]|uniref:hypothetical protein n=1 Tax=endosymbiont GvMRE of Glomus versiforme TaxID=2039283 RepID=UPI000EE54E46|nr:hypothetical protein [endosymbiont GvMRE of Glomus versiforme]RHZ36078.1 hypothetical protein GvMRE_Ic3g133 [endosymbiont GvMRE of Glomus versiforme]
MGNNMQEKEIKVIYGSAGNQIGTFYKCSCCPYYLDKEGIKRHQELASLQNLGIFNHSKKINPAKEIHLHPYLWSIIEDLMKRIEFLEKKGNDDGGEEVKTEDNKEPDGIYCEPTFEDDTNCDYENSGYDLPDKEPDIEYEPEQERNFEPSADFCWTHESDCGSECEEWRKEHQE